MGLDPKAAVRLLVNERSKLVGYIWSIVQDASAAEDLFQDVLIEVMEKAGEIRDDDHLRSWVRQAARFRAVDLMRRRRRERAILSEQVINLLDAHWDRVDRIDSKETIAALSHCMQKLPANARQMVRMRYVDELSGAQIAERLGHQRQSVYMAMTRIYKALAKCIRERVGGAEVTGE